MEIAVPQKASLRPCDIAAMHREIRDELKTKFDGWRLKQLSDLDADNRRVWLGGQSGKACPGFATGHFESAKQTSYAFLLVPKSEPAHGYKIVVLSAKSNGESYASKILDSADGENYSGLVISKAKPGTFSDVESAKKIQTRFDGLVVEWIEKGAMLYYWSGERYERLSISD